LRSNFLQSLAAVLAGNAVYFLLMPYLPAAARHDYRRYDLGLVVDFWICLVFYGLISLIRRWRRHQSHT
jgi:hypothetical protein